MNRDGGQIAEDDVGYASPAPTAGVPVTDDPAEYAALSQVFQVLLFNLGEREHRLLVLDAPFGL